MAQADEWPSDDENDETFTLGEDEPVQKRKKPLERREQKVDKKPDDSNWACLPRPIIFQIAKRLIHQTGDFLQVQKSLALNRHWYDSTHDSTLETHLSLFVRNNEGRGTRSTFDKLRTMLAAFDSSTGLQNVRHLKFTNFHNHMNKSMDILLPKQFQLDSFTVQTSTIGSQTVLDKFVQAHCSKIESLHLNAVRLPPKGLPFLLGISTLTEVRLVDVGNELRNNISWGSMKSLRVLDIFFATKTAASINSTFYLAKLACLSQLQRLQLANISIDERNLEQALSSPGFVGFEQLEKISLRRSFSAQTTYTINVLLFLLKNTPKLTSLDLQGNACFDMEDISVSIGPLVLRPSLTELDLSQCNAKYGLGDLFNCTAEKPNLKRLNMSNMKGLEEKHFDSFILSFVNGNQQLNELEIQKTRISDRQILQILSGDNGLEEIDLTGCYSAPRGWRRAVKRKEFKKLIRTIQQVQ